MSEVIVIRCDGHECHLRQIETMLADVVETQKRILKGQTKMSKEVDDLKTLEQAEEAEISQVLTILTQVRAQVVDQAAQIAALQAQIANLPLSTTDAAAVAEMFAGITAKNAEMTAALNPVVTPPTV